MVRPIAARLFGPALGGWIIMAAGPGWAFIIDACTFGLSAFFLFRLARLRTAGLTGQAADSGQSAGLWSDLREGLSFVRSRVWLWGTFMAATLAYLVFLGPAEVLLPYLIKFELGGTAGDLGLVFALGGLGAVTASLVMAQRQVPHRPMTFIYLAWTLSTLMIAGYGLAQSSWQVMLFCLVFNAFESAGLIVWLTTKQLLVPPALLGRVSSLDWCISTGLMPVSYALAGPAAQLLGARPTLIGAGILGAGITLSFLFLPGMRALEVGGEPAASALLATPALPASDSATY
jgi:hypothetical protein